MVQKGGTATIVWQQAKTREWCHEAQMLRGHKKNTTEKIGTVRADPTAHLGKTQWPQGNAR